MPKRLLAVLVVCAAVLLGALTALMGDHREDDSSDRDADAPQIAGGSATGSKSQSAPTQTTNSSESSRASQDQVEMLRSLLRSQTDVRALYRSIDARLGESALAALIEVAKTDADRNIIHLAITSAKNLDGCGSLTAYLDEMDHGWRDGVRPALRPVQSRMLRQQLVGWTEGADANADQKRAAFGALTGDLKDVQIREIFIKELGAGPEFSAPIFKAFSDALSESGSPMASDDELREAIRPHAIWAVSSNDLDGQLWALDVLQQEKESLRPEDFDALANAPLATMLPSAKARLLTLLQGTARPESAGLHLSMALDSLAMSSERDVRLAAIGMATDVLQSHPGPELAKSYRALLLAAKHDDEAEAVFLSAYGLAVTAVAHKDSISAFLEECSSSQTLAPEVRSMATSYLERLRQVRQP